jgi:hypothetical protein
MIGRGFEMYDRSESGYVTNEIVELLVKFRLQMKCILRMKAAMYLRESPQICCQEKERVHRERDIDRHAARKPISREQHFSASSHRAKQRTSVIDCALFM